MAFWAEGSRALMLLAAACVLIGLVAWGGATPARPEAPMLALYAPPAAGLLKPGALQAAPVVGAAPAAMGPAQSPGLQMPAAPAVPSSAMMPAVVDTPAMDTAPQFVPVGVQPKETSAFMGLSGFFWGLAASFAVGVIMVRKQMNDRKSTLLDAQDNLELGVHPRRAGVPTMVAEVVGEQMTKKKQDFLEADPYWDQKTIPVNTYKNKAPYKGKIISTKRIVGPQATGETCHIIMNHEGKMPYWEGQSAGVIPPGENPKKPGKPNAVRLYSIASSRYGDDMTGTTTSLCVRRATYWCPELKAEDPAKKGVCSNFLCDTKPGDDVMLTGPSGKVMLIPEENPNVDLIMVATGTGIAPYRSFIRRLFVEKTPFGEAYKGLAWLFLGVANTDALLYDDEWQEVLKSHPDNFRLDYALSREQTNVDGGKMYIQDKLKEYSDEVFDRMDKGAHIYFCGLKGMLPGITEMLEDVCKKKGLVWEDKLKEWKKAGQWHVEVY